MSSFICSFSERENKYTILEHYVYSARSDIKCFGIKYFSKGRISIFLYSSGSCPHWNFYQRVSQREIHAFPNKKGPTQRFSLNPSVPYIAVMLTSSCKSSHRLHTKNFFRNLIKSTRSQIVFTIFRLIWIQMEFRFDPNKQENGKYNLISG